MFKMFGYRFQDISILEEALTHCSVQHKKSNQRLEFLGMKFMSFIPYNGSIISMF